MMPSDYPLMPDENPPHVRRRIGASFKLDERLILRDKEVRKNSSLFKQKSVTKSDGLNFRVVFGLFSVDRIQSCKHWKQTWLFISRFMKRPANSPWSSI